MMCQLVSQDTLCSANQELDSAAVDSTWNKSEILDALSVSLGAVSVEMGSLSYGCGESLLLSSCNVPSILSIQRIPSKGAANFSRVQRILDCLREVPTVTGLTHQISSVRLVSGRRNFSCDSVSPEMGENFNPGCTRHLLSEPYCCYSDPDKLNCVDSHFEVCDPQIPVFILPYNKYLCFLLLIH